MKITISDSYDLPTLAINWMDLEARAAGGFFMSWRWIGSWLRTTKAKPLLVTAIDGGITVALGLLNPHRDMRSLTSVRQLCLHEIGLSEFDALMIEHNGFLTAHSVPPEIIVELMHALQLADIRWDEVVLGGVSPALVSAAKAAGLVVEIDRSSPNFGVDLAIGPTKPGRWQDRLSANQRAQIRQSRAFAEKIGPLKLEPAFDTQQALAFFENMMALHTAYWKRRSKPGAFASVFARSFHRELISFQTDLAGVELLELTAGNRVLGYLYNFRYGDRIYNYQSGFSYSSDNRHRPGLVAHTMAIEQAIERKMQVYDFLAGDAHYKARLGSLLGTIIWCRGQRNRPILKVERAVRKLRRGLRRILS